MRRFTQTASIALLFASSACALSSRSEPHDQRVLSSYGHPPGPAQAAHAAKHFFEGVVDYRGVQGKPPGEPFEMHCAMRREDLRCDITTKDPGLPLSLGFRGPGNTLCFKLGPSAAWMPVSLATVGFLFALLPPDLRKRAASQTQAQYRWTGRVDSVLGRACRELEHRDENGLRLTCYSPEEYFEGDQKLVPILHQMGFDPGFVSSLAGGGIGWRSAEWNADGTPRFYAEAVRIAPQPISPATFAGVCNMP